MGEAEWHTAVDPMWAGTLFTPEQSEGFRDLDAIDGVRVPPGVARARALQPDRADNNAILVPMLRAGWVIAAFAVAPRWGLTIHLRKYVVDALMLVHEHRVDGSRVVELRDRGLELP